MNAILCFTMFSFMVVFSIKQNPCYTCKFYSRSTMGGKYDIGSYFGKCRKFGVVETETNDVNYAYAVISRMDENRCGSSGKYYQKAENVSYEEEYE